MPIPIKYHFLGGMMVPASPFWKRMAEREFGEGEEVELIRHEERSSQSHRHEFAWLKSAWESLPDRLLEQFPSAEHLRKFALIKTGQCTMMQYPCTSTAEAQRWAMNLRPLDPYALVIANGSIVTVYMAISQSVTTMNRREFQESKQKIIDYVASLLHVDPTTLGAQQESA